MDTTLAGGESSRGEGAECAATVSPDDEHGSGPRARTGVRLREPLSGATGVRFEFARRAHQREITPNLGINLAKSGSQEERGEFIKKTQKKRRESEAEPVMRTEKWFGRVRTRKRKQRRREITRERACGWVEGPGACSRQDRGRGNSSGRSRGANGRVAGRRGRWRRAGLPTQRRCRWVSHRSR